jgi:Ni,Fe-hydrogenase III large subunit
MTTVTERAALAQSLRLTNRRAVPLADVPALSEAQFRAYLIAATSEGWRVLAFFGVPEKAHELRLLLLLADDDHGRLAATSTIVERAYDAFTPDCPALSRFEREIAEQSGVVPRGHPFLAPVRRHAADHAPAAWAIESRDREAYPFRHVGGEEVHEVAVGPVHAGIIEPGHFRFQAHGEVVLDLQIMLGYQHRGVEGLLETLDRTRAVLVAESIAGDTVVGHASAACGALEALARSRKSPRAQSVRGIALELERAANHAGDLGALAGDVAFATAAAFFGRLRGDCLNLLMLIGGNRYGRGIVRPGGVHFDIPDDMAGQIRERVQQLRADIAPVASMMFEAPSVQSRFDGVGVVPRAACFEYGFVGPVARACDVARDVRHDHPYGVYRFAQIPVSTAWAGDVFARAFVRRLELDRSLEFVEEQVAALPGGALRADCGLLRPNELAVALEEGWRGEIVHAVVSDLRGGVRRHKVVDPSFRNWDALELALPGNQISDFPLCNKSFNLSYAGHDL